MSIIWDLHTISTKTESLRTCPQPALDTCESCTLLSVATSHTPGVNILFIAHKLAAVLLACSPQQLTSMSATGKSRDLTNVYMGLLMLSSMLGRSILETATVRDRRMLILKTHHIDMMT